jgi:hypothetical protein
MTDYPITPPPELVEQWEEQFEAGRSLYAMFEDIYRAGADVEFEACCEWVSQWAPRWPDGTRTEDELRAARRPKPPTLKEQALDELHISFDRGYLKEGAADTIRRALEQLDD